jgi:hypothetical protein
MCLRENPLNHSSVSQRENLIRLRSRSPSPGARRAERLDEIIYFRNHLTNGNATPNSDKIPGLDYREEIETRVSELPGG